MSTLRYTSSDSMTMFRRSLKHLQRYPSLTLMMAGVPVILLLLFVYVFGGTLGAGLGGAASLGRQAYLQYLTPGMVLLALIGATQITAVSVAMDMTGGIIARFRTMAIARSSVLTGHVLGSMVQTLIAMACVLAVAVLIGFRPAGGPGGWLAAIGLLALATYALTWLAVAFGLFAKSVESASNIPMPLMLLPFLGSGFVPTASMPVGLRWFAEHQPFTPINETMRGLLMGTPIVGNDAAVAVAWCVAIAVVGYAWARMLYDRGPRRVGA